MTAAGLFCGCRRSDRDCYCVGGYGQFGDRAADFTRCLQIPKSHYRCGHPGQQQGRRIPSFKSDRVLSTCCFLVSAFFTEITQQIHSFRANGVMSSHAATAAASAISVARKSAGTLCTTPPEIALLLTDLSHLLGSNHDPAAAAFVVRVAASQAATRFQRSNTLARFEIVCHSPP